MSDRDQLADFVLVEGLSDWVPFIAVASHARYSLDAPDGLVAFEDAWRAMTDLEQRGLVRLGAVRDGFQARTRSLDELHSELLSGFESSSGTWEYLVWADLTPAGKALASSIHRQLRLQFTGVETFLLVGRDTALTIFLDNPDPVSGMWRDSRLTRPSTAWSRASGDVDVPVDALRSFASALQHAIDAGTGDAALDFGSSRISVELRGRRSAIATFAIRVKGWDDHTVLKFRLRSDTQGLRDTVRDAQEAIDAWDLWFPSREATTCRTSASTMTRRPEM